MSEGSAQSSPPAGTPPPETPKSKPAADEIERGDLDYWRDRAGSLFGASPHAVAGALHEDRRKTFTQAQVEKALADFADPEKTPGS